MPPSVSILIPTRNGWSHLEHCLPSLERLTYPGESLRVVVIDNGSSDKTGEHLARLFPKTVHVRHEENLGFAPALNRASLNVESDYVAFLNNDTRVEPEWLSLLVDTLESKESKSRRAVAACGAILDWDETGVQFFGGHINFVGKAFHLRPALDALSSAPPVQPLFYPCGAGMLIERKAFLDSGGFDADYFMIFEDVDLGWRLNLLGLESLLVRDARLYHRESASLNQLDYARKALWWERNALWTIYKNYSDSFLERIWHAALALASKREQILLDAGREADFEAHHQGVVAAIQGLERIQAKRAWIQKNRTVGDREMLRCFPQPFQLWAYAEEHYQLFSQGGYEGYLQDCLERFRVRSLFDRGEES